MLYFSSGSTMTAHRFVTCVILFGILLILPFSSCNNEDELHHCRCDSGGCHCDNVTTTARRVSPQTNSAAGCRDIAASCGPRAHNNECLNNHLFMHSYCPVSCRTCHNRTRVESRSETIDIVSIKKRSRKWGKPVVQAMGSNLGVPQLLTGAAKTRILKRISHATDYVNNIIMADDRYKIVRDTCKNNHELCASWAVNGGCNGDNITDKTIDGDIRLICAPVCFSCDLLHFETRCPVDLNTKHSWFPGDLDKMFRRILHSPHFQQYNPRALSRPNYQKGDSPYTANYTLGPWVLVLDNFVSQQEADTLIEAGHEIGYLQSEDVDDDANEAGEFGSHQSEGRTSVNAWCNEEVCQSKVLVDVVLTRLENLVGIHRNYSEELQILRYEPGQFYERHHDYIEQDRDRIVGSRILTVFLYLSDVEEGGGTHFPDLNITVMPQRGKALLWPSVLNEHPHDKDFRTDHEALPVIRGIKYGANAWVHQRKFRNAYQKGC